MIPVTEFSQEISEILSSDEIDRVSEAGVQALKFGAQQCLVALSCRPYTVEDVISVLYTLLVDPAQIVSSDQIKSMPDRLCSDSVHSDLKTMFESTMTRMRDRLLGAARKDTRFHGTNEAYIDIPTIKADLLRSEREMCRALNEREKDDLCWQSALEWIRALSTAREEKRARDSEDKAWCVV